MTREPEAGNASQRTFLKAATAATAALPLGPAIHSADDKTGAKPVVIGEGEHRYFA